MAACIPMRLTLVLQDDDLVGSFLRDVLAAQGFTVELVSPPAAALAKLRDPGSLIVLEVPGEEEEGLTLVHDVLARMPSARIVVLAVRGSPQAALAYLHAGAADYVLRAVDDLASFLARVRRVADQTAPRAAALAAFDLKVLPSGLRDGMAAIRRELDAP